MTFLWIMLGVLYITLLLSLGLATLRKGHTALFIVGIFFPLLWIVGAPWGQRWRRRPLSRGRA